MNMPDVDDIEIAGAQRSILHEYNNVIGENQARNIAYIALVGARAAKLLYREKNSKKPFDNPREPV